MSMKKLKKVIRKEWNITYYQIDRDVPLIALAEKIACDTEKCTIEEAYNMYIDNPNLHLPGLISLCIIDGLGIDTNKVNCNMTLRTIFEL